MDRRTFELAHESTARYVATGRPLGKPEMTCFHVDIASLEWTRGRANKTIFEDADGIKFHLDAVYAVRRPGAHQAERQA